MPSTLLFEYLTPIALGLMMAGMGLALRPSDFGRLWNKPKAVLVGVLGQMLGLPLLGFAVASGFELSPTQSAGIMILVSCAGGVVSGLLTQMAKGDTALSITMTGISMVIGMFSIPLIINASLQHFLQQSEYIQLDLLPTSLRLFSMTILPVVSGMIVRQRMPLFAARTQPVIARGSNILLAIIIVVTVLGSGNEIAEDLASLVVPIFTLNVLAMLLGYGSARVARLELKAAKTLAIEVGIQNSATGIFIATTLLGNALLALPAMLYTGIAFINVALFIFTFTFRSSFHYAKTI